MAYVINPDGTITTVEADYDRNGNLKPKINSELLNEQVIKYNSNVASDTKTGGGKRSSSKKKTNKNLVSYPHQVNSNKVTEEKQTTKKQDATKRKETRIITRQSIEKYFERKKSLGQLLTEKDLLQAAAVLKSSLLQFFMQKYEQYKDYCINKRRESYNLQLQKDKKKK